MADSPFFSVIIPAYNVEKYIAEAVESIISQTFSDWELIIVDDASTDSTLETLRKYRKNSKIRIIENQENSQGCFVPREIAVAQSRGRFIVPVDGDDLVTATHLESLQKKIIKHDADLVLTEMHRFYLNPDKSLKILPSEKIDINKEWIGKSLVRHTLPEWEIGMAGYAVRRDILIRSIQEVKSKSRSFFLADEMVSRYILFYACKAVFAPVPYLYRKNPDSITSNKFKEILRFDKLIELLLDFTASNFGSESEENKRARKFHILYNIGLYSKDILSGLDDKKKSQVYEIIERNRQKIRQPEYKGLVSSHYYYTSVSPLTVGIPLYRFIRFLRKIFKR